jgi:hypothetical protein
MEVTPEKINKTLYDIMKKNNEKNQNCDILKVYNTEILRDILKRTEEKDAEQAKNDYKKHCINLYLEKVFSQKFGKPKPPNPEDYEDYKNNEDYKYAVNKYDNDQKQFDNDQKQFDNDRKPFDKIKQIKNSTDTYYLELDNSKSVNNLLTNGDVVYYGTLFIKIGKPNWYSNSLIDSFNLNKCNAFKQSLTDNYILDNIWRVRENFSAENYMVNPEYNKARIIEYGHSPDNTSNDLYNIELTNRHNALVDLGALTDVHADQGGKRKSRRRLKRTSRKSNKKATKKSKKSRKSRKSRKIRR